MLSTVPIRTPPSSTPAWGFICPKSGLATVSRKGWFQGSLGGTKLVAVSPTEPTTRPNPTRRASRACLTIMSSAGPQELEERVAAGTRRWRWARLRGAAAPARGSTRRRWGRRGARPAGAGAAGRARARRAAGAGGPGPALRVVGAVDLVAGGVHDQVLAQVVAVGVLLVDGALA